MHISINTLVTCLAVWFLLRWLCEGIAIFKPYVKSAWERLNQKAEDAIGPTPIRGFVSPDDIVRSRGTLSMMPAGTPDHIRYFRPRSLEEIYAAARPMKVKGKRLPFGEYAQDEFNRIENQRLAEEAAKYGPK